VLAHAFILYQLSLKNVIHRKRQKTQNKDAPQCYGLTR